jgi:hypothetical protein
MISHRTRPGTTPCPDTGQRALLANTGLVLPPELDRPELFTDWDRGAYPLGELS